MPGIGGRGSRSPDRPRFFAFVAGYLRNPRGHAQDLGMAEGVLLSTDLESPDAIPYFLWDDPMTVSELRSYLATASEPERLRVLGRILREARDTDVWAFTTVAEVVRLFPKLRPHLGRRLAFSEYLLALWRSLGLIHE